MASTSESPAADAIADKLKTLTLKSSDGEHFDIPESAAVQSVTIKNMVDDGCADNPIPLTNVDAKTLARVIDYLKTHADESMDAEEKKKFDEGFVSVEKEELFEYILAANYLHIRELLDVVAQKIADLIKDKSPEWVRATFGIQNDFTEEEEKAVRDEYRWAYEGMNDNKDY